MDKGKRIFNIVSGSRSGALNIAVTIGEYLSKEGHQVDLIFRKYNKTDIHDAVVIKDRMTLDYVNSLANYIKEKKPDIIIVHGYSTHLWTKMAVAYAKVPLKLIHVEHNAERYTPMRRWLLRRLDRYTDQYICVSKGVAEHLIKQGVPSSKVAVVYNGIDVEKFHVEKQAHAVYTVGMTARFSKQKDQMTLIKAVEYLIKEKGLEIRLILQGEGKQKKLCEQYVRENGLQDRIIFETGAFIELAKKIDVFVLSTHYEGLPLVLCEAMAAKIPVIGTNVIGVNEIIEDGRTGYLVPKDDFLSLESVIEMTKTGIGSQGELNTISSAYRHIKENFLTDAMCKKYSNFIY